MVDERTAKRLARLEKQELDRLRQQLAYAETTLNKLSTSVDQLSTAKTALLRSRGEAVPFDIAGSLQGGLERLNTQLKSEMAEMQTLRDDMHGSLLEQLRQVKQWEVLAGRAARRARAEAAKRDQAALDEAAGMLFSRR